LVQQGKQNQRVIYSIAAAVIIIVGAILLSH